MIIQSIALVRCRALKCVREEPEVETEVELTPTQEASTVPRETPKNNRPRLQTITNYDDEEL